MPTQWNDKWVMTQEELVPRFFNSTNNLALTIHRYKDKPYGIKRVQLGGNGRQMLIDYDSLPQEIKNAIGYPRRKDHILERHFRISGEAVIFFRDFRFDDGTSLKMGIQDKYVINANMLEAIQAMKFERETERTLKGGSKRGVLSSLCQDAISFQEILKVKHNRQHTLPENERRFKQALNAFEKDSFSSLISKKHKNANALKVTDKTLALLNNMFADYSVKPTATEVFRQYKGFILGFVEVINSETGEMYKPGDFKELSESTVTNYMALWVNRIGTHSLRSGDRQKLMGKFKPYHSMSRPKLAGSLLSIDDRQPPFECIEMNGDRVWFYNALDVASDAFTCCVHGKDKKGIIIDFYRQLVRNYHEWGFNLPYELEAEMNLNASFLNSFLKPGAMFQEVRIEANNARGKIIESRFNPLRNRIEKKLNGWKARPFAGRESHQAGPGRAIQLPYNVIVEGSISALEAWNNEPHPDKPEMSKWEYFCQNQDTNLRATNYLSILPYLGEKTITSCNVGIIHLQNEEWLLGENSQVALGEKLISLMKRVEGNDITIYWLDGNDGKMIKALVFIGDQYICEAVAKPEYNRAKNEQTPADAEAREIMSSYVATIEAFGKRQKAALEPLTLIDNTPKKKTFTMPGRPEKALETRETRGSRILPETEEEELVPVATGRSLKDTW